MRGFLTGPSKGIQTDLEDFPETIATEINMSISPVYQKYLSSGSLESATAELETLEASFRERGFDFVLIDKNSTKKWPQLTVYNTRLEQGFRFIVIHNLESDKSQLYRRKISKDEFDSLIAPTIADLDQSQTAREILDEIAT